MLNRAGLGRGCDFLSAVERPAQEPGRVLIAVVLSERATRVAVVHPRSLWLVPIALARTARASVIQGVGPSSIASYRCEGPSDA